MKKIPSKKGSKSIKARGPNASTRPSAKKQSGTTPTKYARETDAGETPTQHVRERDYGPTQYARERDYGETPTKYARERAYGETPTKYARERAQGETPTKYARERESESFFDSADDRAVQRLEGKIALLRRMLRQKFDATRDVCKILLQDAAEMQGGGNAVDLVPALLASAMPVLTEITAEYYEAIEALESHRAL